MRTAGTTRPRTAPGLRKRPTTGATVGPAMSPTAPPSDDAPELFRARRPLATLYARLSATAGVTNVSKDGMVADLIAAADRFGYDTRPDMIHMDDGISGAVRDRPHFTAWLDDAREGRAVCLIGFHTDRLSREGANVAGMILDVVEGKDPVTGRVVRPPVRLLDATGAIDSESGDGFRFNFVIQAEVGRGERERMRDRGRSRARRLRPQLRWTGGPAPYGYRVVPMEGHEVSEATPLPPKTLALDETEAAALREAASRLLADPPQTLGRVARWLTETGAIKPRRAAAWSRVVLRQTLTSDVIAGRVTMAKRDANGHRILDKYKRPILEVDPTLEWPAKVLDLATVHELRRVLAVKAPDPSKGPGKYPTRLLSGLLTCHSCLLPLTTTARSNGTRSYGCYTRSSGGQCEGTVTIDAPGVEAYVTDLLLSVAGDAPNYATRVVVTGADDVPLIDEEIAAVTRSFGAPGADYAALGARMAELQAARTVAVSRPVERRSETYATGDTLRDTWERSNTDDRRDIIAAWFDLLEVGPAKRGGSRYRGFDGAARVTVGWAELAHEILTDLADPTA